MVNQKKLSDNWNFRSKIEEHFRYLFSELGFKFINIEDDCGDNVAVAMSPNLELRFIQDRADFFLDVRPVSSTQKWIGFYEILAELKEEEIIDGEFKISNKIRNVSVFLYKYFEFVKNWASSQSQTRQSQP